MSNQPSWLTAEYLTRILKNFYNDPELKITGINVTSGSKDGDGFSSQIFRIKIDATTRKIAIIAKMIKTSSSVQTVEEKLDYYNPEKFMYQVVLPKMFEKLPLGTLKFFPEFYHADDVNRALFIQDLCEDGYRLSDYSSGVDLQHSLLVMGALAKFHASSYLVFKQEPNLIKNLQKIFYSEDLASIIETALISTTRKGLAAVMDEWDLAEEYKSKLRNTNNWTKKLIESWKKREDGFNVLVQTDCWVKNLMFKYGAQNEVEKVNMIDFQMGTYTSFALDIVNFIYSSSSVEVRLYGVDKLLDHYYEVFKGVAGDVENFSRERLRREFDSKLFVGFIATLVYTPIIMAPPQKKALDYDAMLKNEDAPENFSMYKNPKFLECVEKLMPFFVERNVI